jgi:hypothetical protein
MLTDTKGQASAEELKQAILDKQKEESEKSPEAPEPKPQSILTDAPKETQAPKEPSTEVPPPKEGQGEDALKWASDKGLKTPEDMANSLRNLEREFHKRNQPKEEPKSTQGLPPQQVAQPTYQPPVYQPQPNATLDHYAEQYGMHPDDFKKVLRISQDISDVQIANLRKSFGQELGNLKRSTAKNDDLMSVMRNPNSRHPQVQREIHQILEKNPDMFQRDDAYSQALNEALVKIATNNLNGVIGESPKGQGNVPPSTPPPSGGSGSGSGGQDSSGLQMTEDKFLTLSQVDQAKYLDSIGVRTSN